MERKTLHKSESHGSDGSFGIEIIVSADKLPDLKQDSIWQATYNAADSISSEIQGEIKKNHPKTVAETYKNRKLVELFPSKIFIEEIPCGYCSKWCCRHLPWFVITTKIGRFTIGWRKSVISIDWSDTVGTKGAIELFESEDVTKRDKFIHAWSMEKARAYIGNIINSAT